MSPAVGIYVNNRAAVFGGDRFGLDDLLALGQRAEECGFAFVSVGDSVLAKPRWSPIVTLAAVAEATSTIGLATGILQPHLRHPVTVAQEWATLDALSGGRTALGVGLASTIRGRSPMLDGFGLIAFASLTPMIGVLGYGMDETHRPKVYPLLR